MDCTQHMCVAHVLPGQITIGSKKAALDTSWQQRTGITHILCCAAELKRAHLPGGSKAKPTPGGPLRMHVGLDDRVMPSEQAVQLLMKGAAFIEEALRSGGHVLVHCKHGRNRSASVVCAYLMQRDQLVATVQEVLQQLQATHPKAAPSVFIHHGGALRASLLHGASAEQV
jgi:protein-tyrosine phosphatase